MSGPRVRTRLRRSAQAATLAVCALLLMGCQPGYPTEDMVDDDRPPTAETLLQRLTVLSEAAALPQNWRFDLTAPCELRLRGRSDAGGKTSTLLPLLRLQVDSASDPRTGTIGVTIRYQDGSRARHWRVYETAQWYESVGFSSHLRQLQRLCAETRQIR